MFDIASVLLSGITNGAVYAVMAIGMALVYGVTKVFNFAYGSFFTLGGYIAWTFFAAGLSYPLVLPLSIGCLFLCGLGAEKFVIRPLRVRRDWEMLAMMITLGLALFADNLYLVIYGPFVKSLPAMIEGNL